jgi:hypothetical protein
MSYQSGFRTQQRPVRQGRLPMPQRFSAGSRDQHDGSPGGTAEKTLQATIRERRSNSRDDAKPHDGSE